MFVHGANSFDVCKELVTEQLAKADKSNAFITYKSLDKNYVSNYAAFLKSDAGIAVTQVIHNKSQKSGKSILGIYFYRG